MTRDNRRRANPVLGLILGLGVAGCLSAFVVLQHVLTGGRAVADIGVSLWQVVGLYVAGGAIGGLLFGLALPLATWRWGGVIVGVIAVTPVYLGAAFLLQVEHWLSWVIPAVVVGAVVGYGAWEPLRERLRL